MDNMNNVIGEVGFRFSSRFSQLIGRNLISNPVVAVSELVKNSYDADADNISVEFSNLLSGVPTLKITDDGDGMTFDDIATKWMMVGTDNKVPVRRNVPRGQGGRGVPPRRDGLQGDRHGHEHRRVQVRPVRLCAEGH